MLGVPDKMIINIQVYNIHDIIYINVDVYTNIVHTYWRTMIYMEAKYRYKPIYKHNIEVQE